jgi:hypothetical protein
MVMSGWCHQANKEKGPAVQRIRKFLMYLHSYFSKENSRITPKHDLTMVSTSHQEQAWLDFKACLCVHAGKVSVMSRLLEQETSITMDRIPSSPRRRERRVQRASRHVGDLIHGFSMAWEEDQRDNNHGWRRDSMAEHTNSSLEAAIRSKVYTR